MPAASNQIIDRLPRAERATFLAQCTPREMAVSEVLSRPGDVARHAYFPIEGFISLISEVEGGAGVEVGMVGREGMLGAHLALAVPTQAIHAVVQGEGTMLRIGARAFRSALVNSPALRASVHRYLYVIMTRLATGAACMRFHQVGPRLARWLLMSQDRAGSDTFVVTHEFLAWMLGVRRVGVTTAASELQKSGLIAYRRGHVTVLDRKGLASMACSCYAANESSHATHLVTGRRNQ